MRNILLLLLIIALSSCSMYDELNNRIVELEEKVNELEKVEEPEVADTKTVEDPKAYVRYQVTNISERVQVGIGTLEDSFTPKYSSPFYNELGSYLTENYLSDYYTITPGEYSLSYKSTGESSPWQTALYGVKFLDGSYYTVIISDRAGLPTIDISNKTD